MYVLSMTNTTKTNQVLTDEMVAELRSSPGNTVVRDAQAAIDACEAAVITLDAAGKDYTTAWAQLKAVADNAEKQGHSAAAAWLRHQMNAMKAHHLYFSVDTTKN